MTVFVTTNDLVEYVAANDGALSQQVCDAVNAQLTRYPHLVAEDGTPMPDAKQGALMLAGRLYRRKNSLGGLEAIGDGGVAYVARRDPDVDMLLRLGPYAAPVVG